MELKKGMYVRTTTGRIFKIIEVENKNVFYSCNPPELQWQEQTFIHSKRGLECSNNIVKANEELPALLDRGDFLDTHCISGIKDRTIFLADGWFISFDDVEDLVYSIVTKEQFESIGYKVDEKAC